MVRRLIRSVLLFPDVVKNRMLCLIKGVKYPPNGLLTGRIHIVNRGTITIGNGCKINGSGRANPIGFGGGCNLITEANGHITIGDYVGMSNSTIYSRQSVTIGNNVMIGGGVKIYDTDFHSLDIQYRGTPNDKEHTVNKPVTIHDGVFIGAGTFVLKGVEIGKNTIIGAGSVVTKSIPEGEIWAGNPARFIRKL